MNTIDQMTDDELVGLYQAGSNEAFDVLLSRYQNQVFSYVLMMVKDEFRADDVFQDIFAKVVSNIKMGKYSNQGGMFSNWLMRIAHNVIVDSLRKFNMDSVVDEYPENEIIVGSNSYEYVNSVEDDIVHIQIEKDVWRMVDFLPDVQREVVNMRFRQELPFKDIAKITNVSINTSLGRMRYALINLRRMVREHNITLR